MNCSVVENIGKITKCEIEAENGKTGATFHGITLTDYSKIDLHLMLYTERQGNMKLLMEVRDVNFCQLIGNSSSIDMFSRVVVMFRDVLATKGQLPEKCPILKGTNLLFDMKNFDPKSFPYLPEMKFKFALILHINNIPNVFGVNITGVVVNRRRNRFN